MDTSVVKAYRALHEAQNAISRAQTLDEALQEGLKIIIGNCAVPLIERFSIPKPFGKEHEKKKKEVA